ncbi:MAG: hypothetical protein Q7R96_01545 [Nanoarchaeota archaeon]|nr:hypothetical protein [Nanoarchaeota archaeon]
MIIGFGLNNIVVERKNPLKGKVEIKYNLAMDQIVEEKMAVAPGQLPLRIDFKYEVEYAPKIGNILLNGSIIYLTDEKQGRTLLDNWKKKKKLGDEQVAAVIFNNVLTRCNIKALMLSQEVGLPPHIPLPRAIPKDSAKSYIG